MPKTLKDINWALYVVNLLKAVSAGLVIIFAGNFTLKASFFIVGGLIAADSLAFFSKAQKELSK